MMKVLIPKTLNEMPKPHKKVLLYLKISDTNEFDWALGEWNPPYGWETFDNQALTAYKVIYWYDL